MTVDNTSLLFALKQKPYPCDAGLEVVVDAMREERKGETGVSITTGGIEAENLRQDACASAAFDFIPEGRKRKQ